MLAPSAREIVATIRMRDDATAVLREIANEIEALGGESQGAEESLKSMTRTLAELAASFASGFSAQRMFSGMNEAFATYEQGLLNVAKTTDMVGKELEQYSRAFDDMAMDMSIPIGDLQSIAAAAGQLGVRGAEDINRFTEVIGMLQTATDLTAEDAAMSLARIANITGEGMEGIENYANVVVALGNNVAATEGEITRIATEIARSTSVFGLGSTEIAAWAASFAQIGVQAEIGGTSMGRVLRELSTAAAEGGAGMEHITQMTGMTQEAFENLVKTDPSKAMEAFLGGLRPVLGDTARLNRVLDDLNLKGEEINKTIIPLASSFSVVGEAMAIAREESTKLTAAELEYQRFAEGRIATMTRISNQTTVMMKELGAALDPIMAPMLAFTEGVLSDLVEWFRDLSPEMRTMTSVALIAVPALLSLAAGLSAISFVLPLLSVGFSALLGPIGLAMAAITTLALAIGETEFNVDEANTALSDSDSAMASYANAVKRAKEEQEEFGGAISESTQKMLEQSRVAMMEARDRNLQVLRDTNKDATGGGLNILNISEVGKLKTEMDSRGDYNYASYELRELREALISVNQGETPLQDIAHDLERIANVSNVAKDEIEDLYTSWRRDSLTSQQTARILELARATGVLNREVAAYDSAQTPEQRDESMDRLAQALSAVTTMGEQLRNGGDDGLLQMAVSARDAEQEVDELTAKLNESEQQIRDMSTTNPMQGVTDGATEAIEAIQNLSLAMNDLPKEIQTSLKTTENYTDGTEAAMQILRRREGFQSQAYPDWSYNDKGERYNSGWRIGYGSDTRYNESGERVRVQPGDTTTVEAANRDLIYRISNEFMRAAIEAVGQARWDTFTPAQQGYMTSLSYNYGENAWDNPNTLGRVKDAASTGDAQAIAEAIASLASQNKGVNAERRLEEAGAFANSVGLGGAERAFDQAEQTRQREAEAAAKKAVDEKTRADKEAADAVREKIKAQQEFLQSMDDTTRRMQLETEMVGMNTREKAELLEREKLLTEARKQGLDLDKEIDATGQTLRQNIEQQAVQVGILAEQYENLSEKQQRIDAAGAGFMREFQNAVDDMVQSLENSASMAEGTVDAIGSGVGTFLDMMLDENMKFFDALKGTAATVLADIGRMLIEHAMKVLIFKHLLGFMGGGASPDALTAGLQGAGLGAIAPSAKGNAFGDSVEFFARGGDFTNGVYNQPTMFSFGGGKLGVMGEAGPEAVMPLEDSGKGGKGIVFETIDPLTKRKVRRVIPLARDTHGMLIASDAQFFARGAGFGADVIAPYKDMSSHVAAAAIGQLSVNTNLNVSGGNGGGAPMDKERAGAVSKVIENEVQSTVARVITDMMRPGGLLYGR